MEAFLYQRVQALVFQAQVAHLDGGGQDGQESLQLKRFEHVIDGAQFDRLDGGLHRALPGHDDPDQIRMNIQPRLQQRNAAHLWHHQVADQHVESLLP